jgi:dipeptidyl-peptidase-4
MLGTHTYDISPNGRVAVHTHSRADVPPRAALISVADHGVVSKLVDNQRLEQRLAALVRHPTEFLQVMIDPDVTLDGLVVKPSSFDPGRKYPLIVFAYTEPFASSVDDRWGGTGAGGPGTSWSTCPLRRSGISS